MVGAGERVTLVLGRGVTGAGDVVTFGVTPVGTGSRLGAGEVVGVETVNVAAYVWPASTVRVKGLVEEMLVLPVVVARRVYVSLVVLRLSKEKEPVDVDLFAVDPVLVFFSTSATVPV